MSDTAFTFRSPYKAQSPSAATVRASLRFRDHCEDGTAHADTGLGQQSRKDCTVSANDPLFTTQSKYCGEVILTPDRWAHVLKYHPEVGPYVDAVRLTVEEPWAVYETPNKRPTYAYYRRELITDDPRFKGCYVAVFVRYRMQPAQVWTVYLPTHLSSNPGKLIHLQR